MAERYLKRKNRCLLDRKKTIAPRQATRFAPKAETAAGSDHLTALVLVAVVFAFALHTQSARRTLPERVQAHMPAWVTQELLTPNEYSVPKSRSNRSTPSSFIMSATPAPLPRPTAATLRVLPSAAKPMPAPTLSLGWTAKSFSAFPSAKWLTVPATGTTTLFPLKFATPMRKGASTMLLWIPWCASPPGCAGNSALDPQRDVIRHYDVTGSECPLTTSNPDAWQIFKEQVQSAVEEERQFITSPGSVPIRGLFLFL